MWRATRISNTIQFCLKNHYHQEKLATACLATNQPSNPPFKARIQNRLKNLQDTTKNLMKKKPHLEISGVQKRLNTLDLKVETRFQDEEKHYKSKLMQNFARACQFSEKGIESAVFYFSKVSPLNIEIFAYEELFVTLAKKGQLQWMQDFWSILIKHDIQPSLKCYAALFQCLGHEDIDKETDDLQIIAKELHAELIKNDNYKGFTSFLKLNLCKTNAELEQLVKGIQMVEPDFSLPKQSSSLSEDCESNVLLQDMFKLKNQHLSSPFHEPLSELEISRLLDKQLEAESKGYVEIENIATNLPYDQDQVNVAQECIETLFDSWSEVISHSIKNQVEIASKYGMHGLMKSKAHPGLPVFVFLELLSPQVTAEIILKQVRKLLLESATYSPSVFILSLEMGKEIMEKINMEQYGQNKEIIDRYKAILKEYYQWLNNPGPENSQGLTCQTFRHAWLEIEAKHWYGSSSRFEPVEWPDQLQMMVGKIFFKVMDKLTMDIVGKSIIIKDKCLGLNSKGQLTIRPFLESKSKKQSVPALYKILRHRGLKKSYEMKPHPILAQLFEISTAKSFKFNTSYLPMYVPPLPRSCIEKGGFLLTSSEFCRIDASLKEKHDWAQKQGQAWPVLDCLNLLGSTPWKLNKDLLKVVLEVFNNQSNYTDILDTLSIPMNPKLIAEPELPNNLINKDKRDFSKWSKNDRNTFHKYQEKVEEWRKLTAESNSLWCDTRYKLSIANHFQDDMMFFPHNIDFRGRVYPLAPYFHHMGGDLSRSLLMFAKGLPLGPSGFDWLKIHCINLTELKKKSPVEERLQYAEEIMPEILDSANHPLTGSRWWLQAEDPWQTLAACIEIRNALQCPEGPENYVSHLTVHQDGSCNGLQHYSALGRDELGATYVNVVPGEAPQDIYGEIAALVEKKRKEDELKNPDSIAAAMQGFVTRKVIKQTVMTTVYGVTKYGAKLQIAKQLKALDNFPSRKVQAGALYLTERTFDSLNEMFTSSQAIQAWFTDCANFISDDFLKYVEWVTPLGLYVMQPYSKSISIKKDQVRIIKGGLFIFDA